MITISGKYGKAWIVESIASYHNSYGVMVISADRGLKAPFVDFYLDIDKNSEDVPMDKYQFCNILEFNEGYKKFLIFYTNFNKTDKELKIIITFINEIEEILGSSTNVVLTHK